MVFTLVNSLTKESKTFNGKSIHPAISLPPLICLSIYIPIYPVIQLLKNPPTMRETWVRSLGWEDPLEKGRLPTPVFLGFPRGLAGKASARNVGDLDSIPGLGRSFGEGVGYPSQYSWASLMAWLVKHLRTMWETWVQSLGWEPCNLWSAPDWFLLSRWHGVMADGLRLSELGYLDHSVSLPFLPSFLFTLKFTEGRSCVSKSLTPQFDSVP